MRKGCFVAALIAAGLLLAGRVGGVAAQETPRHGGELVFVVPAEPPSFDARREESFALIHPAAPHYSTLMRVDPEPGLALFKFQSADVSHVNYSRYTDRTLDELYQRQSRATDREERRRAIREFEKRLLDDEVHYIFTFQWHRIVPHNARLRGWTITPSHFLNNQLDTVWLAPE